MKTPPEPGRFLEKDCADEHGAAVFDFVVAYLDDLDAGREQGLNDYLRRFPGQDSAIAAEYLRQEKLQNKHSTEVGQDGGPLPTQSERPALHRAAGPLRDMPSSAFRPLEGEYLGDFHLLHLMGRGGMGEVWEAEQLSLSRRVALKLLLPQRIDQQGLDYFAREARAGGRLAHPGIVSVFGTGEDEGLHWIAMELVDGGCDLRHSLESLREEGELPKDYYRDVAQFVAELADALEVAHAAGVIHRDLKPANVLVTPEERPKLLDFGLAKLTDEMSISLAGDLVGTYFYMSPEQVAAKRAGLDHRTDVFSLGVMLYEMLTLVRPFEGDTTEQVANKILWDEPPSPKDIRSKVPQDLAVICGKCLEKRRDVRYGSMAELAAELRRYLADEPILARPPGAVQRTAKWVRRNPTKSSLMGLGTAALVVISGLALRIADEKDKTVTALERAQVAEVDARTEAARAVTAQEEEAAQRVEAEEARAEAELARSEAELARSEAELARSEAELARSEAEQRAEDLQQVSEFQAEHLSSIDVSAMGQGIRTGLLDAVWKTGELGGRTTEELEKARADLEQQVAGADFTGLALAALDEHVFIGALEALAEFENQPLVQAQLLHSLGSTLVALGLLDRALEPQKQALAIIRREFGDEAPYTLTATNRLAEVLLRQDKLDLAEPLFREVLETSRRALGADHESTLTAINNHGAVLRLQGRHAESEAPYREALDGRRKTLGDEHPDTLASLNNLGNVLMELGRLDEAEHMLQEAFEGSQRALGPDHEMTLLAANNLGNLLSKLGKSSEAEVLVRRVLDSRRGIFGDRHPSTLVSFNNLAAILNSQGKLEEAEPLYRTAAKVSGEVLGDEHRDTLISISNLAGLLEKQGKSEEAEQLRRQVLGGFRLTLGDDHPYTLVSLNNLGMLLEADGRLGEAEPFLREPLNSFRRTLGPQHPTTLTAAHNLGSLLRKQGKLDEAEPYSRQALEGRRALFAEGHPAILTSVWCLAILLKEQGNLDEAEELAREAVGFNSGDASSLAKRQALLDEILALRADATDKPADQTRESDDGG